MALTNANVLITLSENHSQGDTNASKAVALGGVRRALSFYVHRRKVIVLDANHLKATHKTECLDKLAYNLEHNLKSGIRFSDKLCDKTKR